MQVLTVLSLPNKAEGVSLSFDPANAIDISAGNVDLSTPGEQAFQMTDVETEWSWVTTKGCNI